jgi:cobalt-zinc-cadmium resistance protein CzcA
MIQRLVAFALRMPAVILTMGVLLIATGLAAYADLDIEAYPNPVPPLVEVITQPPGWSAEETERYVTIPLEIGLAGMPGLEHIRSASLFQLSDVKCYFRWGTQYKDARQEVINRLQFVALPTGIQAQLSPWNAIGEVFRYTLRGKGYSLKDLKTAEDWILERQFKQVDGVIDVTSYGGETKEYHVSVDPYRLRGQGVTLTQVESSIQNANQNVGGQRLFIGEQSYDIRGIGLIKDVHDIENIVVAETKGTPVRVRDVAAVDIGFAPRLGIVGHDDEPDVVQGIILMRYGAETPHTLEGIYKRLEHIKRYHLLRPRRAGEGDDAHGAREPDCRNGSRRRRPIPLPRAYAGGVDYGPQHSPRPLDRLLRPRGHEHVGQPYFARRRRLRHRGRFDGHHDGKYVPSLGPAR